MVNVTEKKSGCGFQAWLHPGPQTVSSQCIPSIPPRALLPSACESRSSPCGRDHRNSRCPTLGLLLGLPLGQYPPFPLQRGAHQPAACGVCLCLWAHPPGTEKVAGQGAVTSNQSLCRCFVRSDPRGGLEASAQFCLLPLYLPQGSPQSIPCSPNSLSAPASPNCLLCTLRSSS